MCVRTYPTRRTSPRSYFASEVRVARLAVGSSPKAQYRLPQVRHWYMPCTGHMSELCVNVHHAVPILD